MFSMRIISIFLIFNFSNFIKTESESFSFDSLISSQCKARCLSLYPWKINSTTSLSTLERKLRSTDTKHFKRFTNMSDSSSIKWHKVMDLCSKNQNCLQCSIPCEIPTNLLSNCKYLCKNRHPFCLDSCNLLSKLNDEKHGSCPNNLKFQVSSSLIASFNSIATQNQKCTNITKSLAISNLIRNNHIEDSSSSSSNINQCSKDSDCQNIQKCCSISADCPEFGNICQKPVINNFNLPSIPFNLTITERKKGKTVILSWDCVYNKNKPTIFVVEGRWSLKSPSENTNPDQSMTKWGYLAQTTNNNWIILRSINRGRWYKFRVASVSKSGSFGYSQSTELFILSSAPKPPSQPQNLTITQTYQSDSNKNKVNVDLSWLSSKKSDLPITDYKLTWIQRANNSDDSYFNQNEYEESDEFDSNDVSSDLILDNKIEQSETYGTILLDAQTANKYTIKNLNKNSIYSIELIAVSRYESKLLASQAIKVKLDTSIVNTQPVSSFLLSDRVGLNINPKQQEYDDDEDDLLDDETEPNELNKQTRNSPAHLELIKQQPLLIKNLTIQTPYFQNGLVKAKLSWLIEQQNQDSSLISKEQASIYSKTLIDQPMFTITWFAIKCLKTSDNHHNLIPITATTINTHFEIYELRYNCDYVVNVKLVNSNKFSSPRQAQIAPQVASAQFKVPHCPTIKILGRIKPSCYERYLEPIEQETSSTSSTTTTTTTSSILKAEKKYDSDVYRLLFSSTRFSSTTSSSSVYATLPKINGIKYKLVEKSAKNLYSVEFTWNLPIFYNREAFNGYQISVVPKEIPGMGPVNEAGGYFGSVGAIVSKDQDSFVVRQLSASVRYIFQIQAIGNDGQSYGPVSNLEFIIEDKHLKKNENINRLDYDFDYQTTSSPDYYQYSHSSSIYFNLKFNFIIILVINFLINFKISILK